MSNSRTIEEVVSNGLCAGCGTCAGICPKDAIEMVIDHHKGVYIPKLDNEKCSDCGLCFDVCPGHEVNFRELNRSIFGKEPEDILLGNHLNLYAGYATDYDIRYNSTSGGLITALLIFALEEGLIEGALVTRMNKDRPLEPEPFIVRTRQEIIEASRSKYCPVPANTALNEILDKEGKYAVVGLPCHLHGVRKAEKLHNRLREKIELHFGLFCNHTPSFLATEYVFHNVKVRKEEVKRLDYRGEGWPGKMKVTLENREIQIQLNDYWGSGFGSLFYPWRCTLCADMVAELSDFSFGDAWLGELSQDKVGTSMLISRSEKGEELLKRALHKDKIALEPTTRNKIVWSTREVTNFKKRVTARFFLLKHVSKVVPSYNTPFLRLGARAYLNSFYCYLRMYLGKRRCLWGQLWTLSHLSHLPRSIASRILKALGLYNTVARLVRGF